MLTNEMKRQVFLKLRTENYRASLRLEGLEPRTVSTTKSTTKPVVLKLFDSTTGVEKGWMIVKNGTNVLAVGGSAARPL